MDFIKHSELKGLHAFLGASTHSWLNYDVDKLHSRYLNHLAVQRGTELHAFAAEAIRLGIKVVQNHTTLSMFINDAIGYRMTPEQPLLYSENCFGTADAISFRKNQLRIHDLKTGVTPTSMAQLEIYAALFCLEYEKDPFEIKIELRIYQSDEVVVHIPEPEDIVAIMDKIRIFDKHLDEWRSELDA